MLNPPGCATVASSQNMFLIKELTRLGGSDQFSLRTKKLVMLGASTYFSSFCTVQGYKHQVSRQLFPGFLLLGVLLEGTLASLPGWSKGEPQGNNIFVCWRVWLWLGLTLSLASGIYCGGGGPDCGQLPRLPGGAEMNPGSPTGFCVLGSAKCETESEHLIGASMWAKRRSVDIQKLVLLDV